MFLPSEGLYAEVLRMPGLFERLQRELHVTPAGPVVVSALLNSLLMGFMTLAMEKRSADVWAILGEVKTEFESFTKQFAMVEKKFREAQASLEQMNTRTRAVEKRMRAIDLQVELPTTPHAAPPARASLAEFDALAAPVKPSSAQDTAQAEC